MTQSRMNVLTATNDYLSRTIKGLRLAKMHDEADICEAVLSCIVLKQVELAHDLNLLEKMK